MIHALSFRSIPGPSRLFFLSRKILKYFGTVVLLETRRDKQHNRAMDLFQLFGLHQ